MANFWDDLVTQRQEARQGVDSPVLRRKLFKKQNGRCALCPGQMKSGDQTLDHVLPHSLGGPYVLANLVLTHQSCNERRGSRFNDGLLEKLPNSVLGLAIENLQYLRADAYEATSENQAQVLKARKEMEAKILALLIQNLHTRHVKFTDDREPGWERRVKQNHQATNKRNEAFYQKILAEFRKGVIGKRISRHEKKENMVSSFSTIPRKELTISRCKMDGVINRRKAA